ncbi:type VI secretion system baseplate subunit TssK [Candidatus Thiosymbion oneisti]|uniref:type VI secretion system baseplate subunit TssK n=1 Tax=Candidatus Thiosymbion oneisti TaxID=589554 RepID=UPI000B16ACA3|nr:type VI secretion system baseplate subunit TssK [Candidatus Thiosymbion oneisti]
MSWNSKVLWSEGMFLQPHHFQQHDRYLEHLVGATSAVATPYPWGVQRLTVDTELLGLGKVALVEAKGLLPDGTPFDLPADGPPPPALELDETVKEAIVYLALPLRQPGLVEAGGAEATDATLRYRSHTEEVRDNHTGPQQTEAPVEVGTLELRLLLDRDDRNGFAHTGLVRVLECRADKRIVLDDAYIPPCVDCKASPRLAGFVGELLGLLHHRGETLAARVSGSGRSGVAEWADFLLLQVINRLEPLTSHLDAIAGLHPELLYRLLLPMAGELATFTIREKRPPEFPTYRHDDLAGTFTPVMVALREALSRVLEERAIPIPIQERKFGFRVAPLSDRTLLADAGFILAAHAKVNTEVLRNRFPAQVKIGPVEKIQELVKLALPGIALRPLPVAPRQIPFHAGFVYFELDRSSELWEQLEHSGGFSLHIGGEFPDLELEFWAVRE